jgi:predicted transcriptional regulator
VSKYKPENFGKNLKEIIDDLDMSQCEMSKRCGLTEAAISQIISGERDPSLKTIVKILNTIPTTMERLLK